MPWVILQHEKETIINTLSKTTHARMHGFIIKRTATTAATKTTLPE
jgi:hypothetical protein